MQFTRNGTELIYTDPIRRFARVRHTGQISNFRSARMTPVRRRKLSTSHTFLIDVDEKREAFYDAGKHNCFASTATLAVMPLVALAYRHLHSQSVASLRERARPRWVVSAGRVVGKVEVEHE